MKKISNKSTTNPATMNRSPSCLKFSPTAWAKLLYLRDVGDTEIGGFGVAMHDDLLLVEDLHLVRQTCSAVHVEFDDAAVADFFDRQVDAGQKPEQFARIWIHTHPGNSPRPSRTDEVTFARVFGGAEWALMFILAQGGDSYARLRYNVGPGVDVELEVEVDYSRPFAATSSELWQQEYEACVHVPKVPHSQARKSNCATVDDGRPDALLEETWLDCLNTEEAHQEAEYGYIREF